MPVLTVGEKKRDRINPNRPIMSYIERNLNPNETVVHRAKLHWIIFLKPIIFWIISVSLARSQSEDIVVWGWLMIIMIAIPYSISILITYLTSEFGVTDKRVIAKIGFIRRTSLETLLQKIEGIDVDQGILGRIFNFGLITVRGVGGSSKPIKNIAAPMDLRRAIYNQVEKQNEREAPTNRGR